MLVGVSTIYKLLAEASDGYIRDDKKVEMCIQFELHVQKTAISKIQNIILFLWILNYR